MKELPKIIPLNEQKSRRDFIKGAAVAVAAAAVTACSSKDPFTAVGENAAQPSGEKVKLLSVTGEIIEVDKAYLKPIPETPHVSNEEARIGIPGKKFVMVIDLAHCHNLKKCQSACNHAHFVHDHQN